MNHQQHGQIVSFIWRIADDILRDVYVRGKYRDVILPMTMIRRLDALLEPSKQRVLDQDAWASKSGFAREEDRAPILTKAAGLPFYNRSQYTLRQLLGSPANIDSNLREYLNGFSANVRDILDAFEFQNQIPRLHREQRLGPLIERFTDSSINLSPEPRNGLPGLDNHGMGTIFEELLFRFNEDNNEEAGEHFTPRDVVTLMTNLVVEPVADQLKDVRHLVYDGACGTGGMLSVAEDHLEAVAVRRNKRIRADVYGQEVNPETWAIAKADRLIKGASAQNIRSGSTLASDAFASMTFEFMLSNPPYGKSWKTDLDRLGGKAAMRDPRFEISFGGDPEYSLVTRSSDGQLMFLVNMLSKMKHDTPLGSRIAEVHNGSSLFTGDAGQGESNIRRWIIENDWLEAIVALPNNMFYNTGIATYIWVISNRKAQPRQGKVQLIDATNRFTPLRKNLGQKNAELSDADQQAILDEFLAFKETETSKIFPNEAFGYWKVTVERPLRLRTVIPAADSVRADPVSIRVGADPVPGRQPGRPQGDNDTTDAYLALSQPIRDTLQTVARDAGKRVFDDYNAFEQALAHAAKTNGLRITASVKKQVRNAIATRDENATPTTKSTSGDITDFEPDPELRDTEQIPLTEPGGIQGFIEREVLPYAPDAWVADGSEKIGYEISFTRHFYKPQQLRTLTEIEADIRALETETEGLLEEILVAAH